MWACMCVLFNEKHLHILTETYRDVLFFCSLEILGSSLLKA